MNNELLKAFELAFAGAGQPKFQVTAPGRVNLIGEHIDYSGYGVLPMALESSITAQVSVTDDGIITLKNSCDKYPLVWAPVMAVRKLAETRIICLSHREFSCNGNEEILIDRNKPEWYKYFLCGVKGAKEYLATLDKTFQFGMNILVSGDLPPSAGLSSSSALVVCATLVTLKRAEGEELSLKKEKVAEIAAKCERYIGTEGGGMDQAICLLGEKGKACKIDFNPIRCEPVGIPDRGVFVVAHSGVEANKAAFSYFNERVVECRLAAMVLAKSEGFPDIADGCRTLGRVQTKFAEKFDGMLSLLDARVHKEPYTRQELETLLGYAPGAPEFEAVCLSPNTLHMTKFELYKRAKHVWSEAGRVVEFAEICRSGNGELKELGQLMNESHDSCSALYDCSCPELDELTAKAREGGALGSRLTGAGWGGCSVSLVPQDQVKTFMESLKDYYQKRDKMEYFEKFVFVSSPAQGATISGQ